MAVQMVWWVMSRKLSEVASGMGYEKDGDMIFISRQLCLLK